jgi:hypothetical protein
VQKKEIVVLRGRLFPGVLQEKRQFFLFGNEGGSHRREGDLLSATKQRVERTTLAEF